MAKTLGIYVSSDHHLADLIQLCQAAKKKDIAVHIFFTHRGTRLVTDPRFSELTAMAQVALCKVGFEDNGLPRSEVKLEDKSFASQMWHTEMINNCDRYLTF
jgi:hypothetical protein